MTGDCCGEPGCRRSQPIALYLGDFSGTAWAATRWRKAARGTRNTMIARERHDVTAQVREFIRRNPEWVRAQLAEEAGMGDGPGLACPGCGSPDVDMRRGLLCGTCAETAVAAAVSGDSGYRAFHDGCGGMISFGIAGDGFCTRCEDENVGFDDYTLTAVKPPAPEGGGRDG